MARTVRDAIVAALNTIGYIGPSDALDDDAANAALLRFQDLVDAWAAQRLLLYTITRVTKALTSGVASYTIGTGGDINITWPEYIDAAAIILANSNPPQEVPIPILTDGRWDEIRIKTLPSSLAFVGYYDHAFVAGLGTFSLYPVPNVAGLTLVLYVPTALATPVNTGDTLVVPPGLNRAFRYNLASDLADEFGAIGPHIDRIIAKATQSLKVVQRANYRPAELRGNALMSGRGPGDGTFNWMTGNFS